MLTRPQANWTSWVLDQTGAQAIIESELIQELWGGYGELLRLTLAGGSEPSVILKRMVPPKAAKESVSDARKRRSYEVEQAWYESGAQSCDESCRVARRLAAGKSDGASLLLLEDLGNAGFVPGRPPRERNIRAGLLWLAHFHSRFLGVRPPGLWKHGSYWHLSTRQDEWARMPSGPLKEHAKAIDETMKKARFQTVLHGDAKPSNFLWSIEDHAKAAAVDFQYVGPGCGIRDVAYFLDCCLDERGCEQHGERWLDVYFTTLRQAMQQDGHEAHAQDLESEWRSLFSVAWTDLCRFYQGWGHPSPMGSYSKAMLRDALALL